MKKFLSVILCVAVIAGVVGLGITLVNNNKPQETFVPDRIVTLDGETANLTDKQLKSLESGADISFGSEMYRLSKVGDENIYEHTDGENIFVTKYIGVNATDKTYRTWEKVNEEVVTKALMSNVLSGYTSSSALTETLKKYVSDEQLIEILAEYEKGSDLTETLKKYVTDEQLTEILADYVKGTDLTKTLKGYVSDEELANILAEYEKCSDLTAILGKYLTAEQTKAVLQGYYSKTEIANMLSDYIKNSDKKSLVNMYLTTLLTFKPNAMYAVQCFDNTSNLSDFKIIGGGKDGKTGRFAIVFVGDKVTDSLIVYQTGTIIISDLAGTSGGSTGIKPASSSDYLRVFEISGNVLKETEYKITYLDSYSGQELFKVGSEFGLSKQADGNYPETYTQGTSVSISNLKSNFSCGGVGSDYCGNKKGQGVYGNASYLFKGWYFDKAKTKPFNGTIPAGTTGDITLYADIEQTGTHNY